MKFSSMIRRALKPLVIGRGIMYYKGSDCWGLADAAHATYTITNVHFRWITRHGEDWRDRDTETYMISVRAVNADGNEIVVDLPNVALVDFDRKSDEINHKKIIP